MNQGIKRVAVLVVAAIPVLYTCAQAQQEVTVGPWTARIGADGLEGLAWRGEIVISKGTLIGYLPGWKGGRFTLDGGEVTVTDTGAVWHRAVPDNQEATVTLELAPDKARLSLDTTVTAAGPSEWWVMMPPEAVRAGEDHCMAWVNGRLRTLLLNSPIDNINGITEMRFEQPERTVTLRCDGLQMQDRRQRGDGFFFVRVLGSSGDRPVHYQRTIELTITEADPATVEARRAFINQRSARETEIELKNPGFETGDFTGWNHGAFKANKGI